MNRQQQDPRGFTLVELLVVLAIISLLIATLLPALSKARESARVVLCLANQRQMGLGWFSYTSDFRQIPGLSANEGTYGGKPWGTPYFYGGVTLYVSDGAYGSNYVGFMNLGYTVPYIIDGTGFSNPSNMNQCNGKIFYCPGTIVSFETFPRDNNGSQGAAWYSTWTANMGQPLPAGTGTSTVGTYYYRSGMYDINNLTDADPSWGNVTNWMRDNVSKPDARYVANKPMLTCFWRGLNSADPFGAPMMENVTHGGKSTNVLRTDGSAFNWGLPSDMKPVWGWFDAGAYTSTAYNPESFYTQTPWFWVRAERRR